MTLWRVRAPAESAAPDLWSVLAKGVCREPGRGGRADAQGRVAVADSKALKLSNSVKTAHPLVHLERGVLSFLRVLGHEPADDGALLAALGGTLPGPACYHGAPTTLPLALSAGELAISAGLVRGAMEAAGVELLAVRVRVIDEPSFNAIVKETGNKAETTAGAVGAFLREAWCTARGEGERLGVVCDRLGGRAAYTGLIARELGPVEPAAEVDTVEEGAERSRYLVRGKGARRGGVAFLTEGERHHLPVALASMTAKYVRELMMRRFNTHWSARFAGVHPGQELKPTAGYALDARRWLDEVDAAVLPAPERAALVRIA
jgi:hypothetical protein